MKKFLKPACLGGGGVFLLVTILIVSILFVNFNQQQTSNQPKLDEASEITVNAMTSDEIDARLKQIRGYNGEGISFYNYPIEEEEICVDDAFCNSSFYGEYAKFVIKENITYSIPDLKFLDKKNDGLETFIALDLNGHTLSKPGYQIQSNNIVICDSSVIGAGYIPDLTCVVSDYNDNLNNNEHKYLNLQVWGGRIGQLTIDVVSDNLKDIFLTIDGGIVENLVFKDGAESYNLDCHYYGGILAKEAFADNHFKQLTIDLHGDFLTVMNGALTFNAEQIRVEGKGDLYNDQEIVFNTTACIIISDESLLIQSPRISFTNCKGVTLPYALTDCAANKNHPVQIVCDKLYYNGTKFSWY